MSNFNHSSVNVLDQLNRPIQDLRVSVIDRCNFRCTYCMPKEEYGENYQFLTKNKWLSFDQIIRVITVFTQLGVQKVRITGGEPLLRPDLVHLIDRLNHISAIEDLALTTNGSLLSKFAKNLKTAGLNRLTISLDTLDPDVFNHVNGYSGNIDEVLSGIEAARSAGFDQIKLNVVIQKGINDHSIIDLVKYAKDNDHILRFIEYMDVGTCNHWNNEFVVTSKEIFDQINAHFPLKAINPNYYGEVADRYQYLSGEGEVGFVSSVSKPFCQSCTRARLSADGKVYTCLFANHGHDLMPYLTDSTDSTLMESIQRIWKTRTDRYSEQRSEFIKSKTVDKNRVEMFHIGG